MRSSQSTPSGLVGRGGPCAQRMAREFKVFQQLIIAAVPVFRFAGEQPVDDGAGFIRQVGGGRSEVNGKPLDAFQLFDAIGIFGVRWFAREGVEKRGAQRVHVAAVRVRIAIEFFRWHIKRGGPEFLGIVQIALNQSQAEIHDFSGSVAGKEDIAGFDVAVNEAGALSHPQTLNDFGSELQHVCFRLSLGFADAIVEAAAGH